VEEFERLLVRHPLMTHLVRALVWAAHDADGAIVETFRVTEDLAYATDADEEYVLDPARTVGIAHPLNLSAPALARWGDVLSDYEIVPPFPQLGRSVFRLQPEEPEATDILRFKDTKLPAATLVFTLEKLAWARGIPQDGGVFYEHSKPFYGPRVTAVVQYPGVPVGYMDGWDEQVVERCFFVPDIYVPQMYPKHETALPLGRVDPVAVSEVLRDLTSVVQKANR
jgi:hypothetical protein